jgi:hypothetical protein
MNEYGYNWENESNLEDEFGLAFASDYNSQPGGPFSWYKFPALPCGSGYCTPQLGTTLDEYANAATNSAVMYPLSQPGNLDAALAQCGTLSGNLSAASGGQASADCGNLVYSQGSHANFSIDCGDWKGGDCAGRWTGGLHIETNGNGDFWGHNDTASYYTGSGFNWATFSPWNLFLHGGVGYLWGNLVITMFPD